LELRHTRPTVGFQTCEEKISSKSYQTRQFEEVGGLN